MDVSRIWVSEILWPKDATQCNVSKFSVGCFPFGFPTDTLSSSPLVPTSASRGTFGTQTELGQKLALGSLQSAAIKGFRDLTCVDFSDSCKWRNVEGLFIDELDWFRGSGSLDAFHLHSTTGTSQVPVEPYAIVATNSQQLPTAKALLISDTIPCQAGDGEIRLKYWTSPQVQISVCTKRTYKIYPDFDFCSPRVENGDPGPAFINLPGPVDEPFEIFIRAENFVFSGNGLAGGFAIIDDLEYYGDLCPGSRQTASDSSFSVDLLNNNNNQLAPFRPNNDNKQQSVASFPLGIKSGVDDVLEKSGLGLQKRPPFGSHSEAVPTLPSNSFFNPTPTLPPLDTCQLLTCSFSAGECLTYIGNSNWHISHLPVGNPLTGIRGDASKLPYNPLGSFAYATGPSGQVLLRTPSFSLSQSSVLMFAYYKASRDTGFRVTAKRRLAPEEDVLFQAPMINVDSRRWFRETRRLSSGDYEYISYEATNLRQNQFVGLDEILLFDREGLRPLC